MKEEADSEDDCNMVTSAAPAITMKIMKTEEEEEGSEEDDWEEVEGKWEIIRK